MGLSNLKTIGNSVIVKNTVTREEKEDFTKIGRWYCMTQLDPRLSFTYEQVYKLVLRFAHDCRTRAIGNGVIINRMLLSGVKDSVIECNICRECIDNGIILALLVKYSGIAGAFKT